jgi:hypothetical protein
MPRPVVKDLYDKRLNKRLGRSFYRESLLVTLASAVRRGRRWPFPGLGAPE